MIELDSDIVKTGSDAMRQAISLVTHAISTPTTHDKNLLIQKLFTSYQLGRASSEHLAICTESMRQYLANITRKETNSIHAFKVLTTNTAFLDELQHTTFQRAVDHRVEQIRVVEAEIETYHPLESPDLLDRYLACGDQPIIQGIRIRDLAFKRLEELVTALKKRSLIFDDSDDLILHVTENYGNIAGLLRRYHELKAENEQLRAEESAFRGDSSAKRRFFDALTRSQLARLVFLLQKELRMQTCVGNSDTRPPAVDAGHLNFDRVCHPESDDLEFVPREFPTTADPQLVATMTTTTAPDEKLACLRAIVREHEGTNEKLMEAIVALRGTTYPLVADDVSERERRLWELHEKFSAQIVDLMRKIDGCYADTNTLYDALLATLNHSGQSGNAVGGIYQRFSALMDSQVAVGRLLGYHRAVSSSLSDLSFAFGANMLRASDPELETYFKNLPPPKPPSPQQSPQQFFHPTPPPVDDDAPPAPRPFRMNPNDMLKGGKRKRKQVGGHTKELKNCESQFSKPNPIEGAAPSQLVDFLALTYDLKSQARNEPSKPYHRVIADSLRSILARLATDLAESLNGFRADLDMSIDLASQGEEEVLRRPKAEIEIQVGLKTQVDLDTQTEDAEPKGKGKGKAKPPPKRLSRKK